MDIMSERRREGGRSGLWKRRSLIDVENVDRFATTSARRLKFVLQLFSIQDIYLFIY